MGTNSGSEVGDASARAVGSERTGSNRWNDALVVAAGFAITLAVLYDVFRRNRREGR